jgi:hypothetical protein
MKIETIAIVGFVFVATTIAAMMHEHRMDVLHGSYIEGLDRLNDQGMKRLVLAPAIVDHFRWRTRSMIYLTSIIAC